MSFLSSPGPELLHGDPNSSLTLQTHIDVRKGVLDPGPVIAPDRHGESLRVLFLSVPFLFVRRVHTQRYEVGVFNPGGSSLNLLRSFSVFSELDV